MNGIRAFVAHSFSQADKALVNIFVEHFENLANAYPGFSWDHAEQAEPAPLSEKVLAKFENKNVFVGICTRSECATDPNALSALLLTKSAMKVRHVDIEWKTSDWIIQEIGLAVGREMKVILFLEEGLRRPGGLFGDIEHIPFSRSNPHASFDKFLQMLVSLDPKEGIASPITPETKSTEKEEQKEPSGAQDGWEPKAEWDQDQFDEAALKAILVRRDKERFQRIDATYRATALAQGQALLLWEAQAEYFRMLAGEKGTFEKIKRLVDDNPNNDTLIFYLAQGYEKLGEHEVAGRTLERAASKAQEETDKLRYLSEAACEYARADMKSRAREIEENVKGNAEGQERWRFGLLSTLRELAEIEKDNAFQLVVMEQLAELHPDDTSLRFSLAYKHSEIGNKDMAIHHYLKIPSSQRSSTTWNNLGVSFGEFGMPTKSIDAFRTSAKESETLAMSNLGFKLLNTGFMEEAQKECDKALAIKSYHKNIAELIKRLKEVPEEEENKLKETLEKAKPKAAFYRKLGDAIGRKTPTEVAPKWHSSDGALEAKIDGTCLTLHGAHERPANSLRALASPGLLGAQKTVIQKTEFVGQIRGHTFFGHVKRKQDGEYQTLLDLGESEVTMYFNADRTELHVIESPQSVNPSFYTLTRIP